MSTTNYPSASPQGAPPKRDSKNLIIGLLAVGILGTWGYFLWDKNKSDQKITQLQTQYVAVDSSKNELQKSFDAALLDESECFIHSDLWISFFNDPLGA